MFTKPEPEVMDNDRKFRLPKPDFLFATRKRPMWSIAVVVLLVVLGAIRKMRYTGTGQVLAANSNHTSRDHTGTGTTTAGEQQEERENCCICLEPIEDDFINEHDFPLECNHHNSYHAACLQNWTIRWQRCGICRADYKTPEGKAQRQARENQDERETGIQANNDYLRLIEEDVNNRQSLQALIERIRELEEGGYYNDCLVFISFAQRRAEVLTSEGDEERVQFMSEVATINQRIMARNERMGE